MLWLCSAPLLCHGIIMARWIVFAMVFSLLTLRFMDAAVHDPMLHHGHGHENGLAHAVGHVDHTEAPADTPDAADDLHASLHHATHLADHMQRAQTPSLGASSLADVVPIGPGILAHGRSPVPPQRPPSA
jgi:hypothetical protein